jgi:hypothetical protein
MKARRTMARTTLVVLLALLILFTMAADALGQEQHGGAMPNSGNDMLVIEGDAENPSDIEAGYGFVLVRETISFEMTDPEQVTDYGIVYIPPAFTMDSAYPRMESYTWDYDVANYTVQLTNFTRGWVGNYTNITGDTFVLMPEDLNPNEPGEPDPRVNSAYYWNVLVIDTRGRAIMNFTGGGVMTNATEPTVIDLAPLDLPDIGPGSFEASIADLITMTYSLQLEPYTSLTEGFYKMRITGMTFEYGMKMSILVQYRGEIDGDKILFDKLLFLERPVDMDVYITKGKELIVYDGPEGNGPPLSPVHESTGAGDPYTYQTHTTLSVKIMEKGTESTDWNLYLRYAALFGVVLLLLFLVLWSGPRRKDEVEEYGEEDEEGDDEAEDETDDEVPPVVPEKPPKKKRPPKKKSDSKRIEEIEERKANLVKELKGLDARHEDGKISDKDWKATRAALKARTIEVMAELDELKKKEDEEEE